MLQPRRFLFWEWFCVLLGVLLLLAIGSLTNNAQGRLIQVQESQKQIYNSYVSIIQQSQKNAQLLFELQYNNYQLIALLEQTTRLVKTDLPQEHFRQQLQVLLNTQYQTSRQYFPKQQVYLVDGRSVLSLDEPYQSTLNDPTYNAGLQKVLSDHAAYSGLALKNGVYLYHFLFPIFDEHHSLIAVAELGLPLSKIQKQLNNEHGSKSQYLFSKRQLLDAEHKWKTYQEAVLSDDYYVHKATATKPRMNIGFDRKSFAELGTLLSEQNFTDLLKIQAFALPAQIDGQYGFANFLPLRNINGDLIGQLFTFTPSAILAQEKHNKLMLILCVFAFFLLLGVALLSKFTQLKGRLDFHRNAIETLPFPVFCKDDKNRYQCANKAFYEHFDLASDKPLSTQESAFSNEPENIRISAQELLDLGGIDTYQAEVTAEFSTSIYSTTQHVILDTEQQLKGTVGYIFDQTEFLKTQASLKDIQHLQNQLLDNLPVGLRLFSLRKEVTLVNRTFDKLSGFSKAQTLGSECESLFACMQCNPEVCPQNKVRLENKKQHSETVKYKSDKSVGTFAVDYYPLYSVENNLEGVIEITSDISETKSLLDKNHELVIHDQLTGLLNQRGIMNIGENYLRLAERTKKPFFALYFDVYGMRRINHQHGEQAGDALLTDVAEILKVTFRETDLIARIGGDEFLVLLNDSDYINQDSSHFARLELNVQRYNLKSKKEYKLLMDTGIVEYMPKSHQNLQVLIKESEALVSEQQLKRNLL